MNENDLIRRGDALKVAQDLAYLRIQIDDVAEAIAALPAYDRVAKLVDALRDMLAANMSCDDDDIDAVDKARAALEAWEVGK